MIYIAPTILCCCYLNIVDQSIFLAESISSGEVVGTDYAVSQLA